MSDSFTRLAQSVAALREPARVEAFLRELLTPGEIHDFALRWELVELLAAGVAQRQIAAQLGVSLCKITRGAKILKKSDGVVAGLVGRKPARAAKSDGRKSDVKKGMRKNGTRVSRKS